MKYIEDEKSMLFTFEFLKKIFLASFLFKDFAMEKAGEALCKERRECLKQENNEGYKRVLSSIADKEEEVF